MRHSDIIYLVSTKVTYDDLGVPRKETTERKVFANKMSVSANEYYSAGTQGLRPELQFELYTFEYNGETQLKYQNQLYRIIRTPSKGEKIRLICERD